MGEVRVVKDVVPQVLVGRDDFIKALDLLEELKKGFPFFPFGEVLNCMLNQLVSGPSFQQVEIFGGLFLHLPGKEALEDINVLDDARDICRIKSQGLLHVLEDTNEIQHEARRLLES